MFEVPMPNIVKSINTSRFSLGLYERIDRQYVVVYEKLNDPKVLVSSEPIRDIRLALYLYDIKNEELRGN